MEDLKLETKWLCTMRGAIPEPNMALENLMVFNVDDAWIESPRFNAKLVGPGGDWIACNQTAIGSSTSDFCFTAMTVRPFTVFTMACCAWSRILPRRWKKARKLTAMTCISAPHPISKRNLKNMRG